MYINGHGVSKDYSKAIKLTRNSAEQGFAIAQNNMGAAYVHGHGVKKDHAEAIKWYRKAAEQGLSAAQYNIAVSYTAGTGVIEDHEEAVNGFVKLLSKVTLRLKLALARCMQMEKGFLKIMFKPTCGPI